MIFINWQVMKLADEVEDIFVKHLAEDDRRKAMKYLKPTHKKESHAVTFFIGECLLRNNEYMFRLLFGSHYESHHGSHFNVLSTFQYEDIYV